jgi:hypothetical protein
MENVDNSNIELASIYRMTATSFRLSGEVIQTSFSEKAEEMPQNYRSIPFYYLISHARELLLKSALLKRGFTSDRLRKSDLRHNLRSLLESLESQGVKMSPDSTAIIRGLSSQHKDHELRYTALLDNGKPTYTPEPSDVYSMLDELTLATRLRQGGTP